MKMSINHPHITYYYPVKWHLKISSFLGEVMRQRTSSLLDTPPPLPTEMFLEQIGL